MSKVFTTSVATPGCAGSVSARLLAKASRFGPLIGLPWASTSGEARLSGSNLRVLQAGFLLEACLPLMAKRVTRAGSGVKALGFRTQMSSLPTGPVPIRGADPPLKLVALVVKAIRRPFGDHAGE